MTNETLTADKPTTRHPISVPGFEVADVIGQVKQAFAVVATEDGAEKVPLKAIELTLNTVVEKVSGGGLKFTVPVFDVEVSLGGKITAQQTQTITVALKRPTTKFKAPTANVSDALVSGLTTIRDLVKKGLEDEPQLVLDEGSMELKFAVTAGGKAELVVASGEYSSSWTHTLKVIVGEPDE